MCGAGAGAVITFFLPSLFFPVFLFQWQESGQQQVSIADLLNRQRVQCMIQDARFLVVLQQRFLRGQP